MDNIFVYSWITAFTISALFTPIVILFAKRFGIIDDPKKNNHPKIIHTRPTPRAGGLSIFISIFISILIYLNLDFKILSILIGGFILVLTGVIDDKYNLNPYLRLIIGFIASSIPVFAGIGISYVTNPLGGIINFNNYELLSKLIAIVWITFLMNMVNMGAKGVDGQLSGVVAISALTISFLTLKFSTDLSQYPIIIISAITAGAFLGFLPWHINPQKIMPGYGGSTLAGYLLAILSIMSTTKIGLLVVVLGIPLIDTGYTIIRRILNKKSPVWGDRGHLHHRLLDAGLSKSQVALFYWVTTAILGVLAINLNTLPKLYTIVGIALFVGGLILWLGSKTWSKKN